MVVPTCNEERRSRADAFEAFIASQPFVDVLFVNDGSTDGTGAMLDGLAAHRGAFLASTGAPSTGGSVRNGPYRT